MNPAIRRISPPPVLSPRPLSSLLPPSVDPRRAAVDLLSSRLRHHSPSFCADELRLHLPHLGPSEISAILLRSLSLPPPTLLRFLSWARCHLSPNSTTPFHYSLLILLLSRYPDLSHLSFQSLLTLLTHPHLSPPDPFSSLQSASHYLSDSAAAAAAFSLLIRAFIRLNRITDAINACSRSVDLGLIPDLSAFNSLMSSLASSSLCDRCWHLFDKMRDAGVRPNCFTFNILTRALCRSKSSAMDGSRVRDFLEMMEMEGFDPDLVTYNTLIHGYCQKGLLQSAYQLFGVMPERGIQPDLISYTILIRIFCRGGRSAEAHRLFDKMINMGINPDIIAYNCLILGYCREGKMRESRWLLMDMIQRDIKPDAFTCKVVVQGFVRNGKTLTCLNVIVLLRKLGIGIPFECYEWVISALCSLLRPHAALSLSKWMLEDKYKLTFEICNLIIDALCKCGFLKEALNLKHEMVCNGVRPNFLTFRILICSLCGAGRSLEGENLVMEMAGYSLLPDSDICYWTVSGFCKDGAFDKAESIIRYFVEKLQIYDSRSCNTIIRSYCEHKDANSAFELNDRMIKLGFVPNRETCKSLIFGLSRSQLVDNPAIS